MEKPIKSKVHFIINAILCGTSFCNLWVNANYKYMSTGDSLSIVYLSISLMSINGALYAKRQKKQREFRANVICCFLFILLAIFIFFKTR